MKAGAVRHMGETGWVETEPGAPLFSTALMVAEEHFDGVRWLPIFDTCETDAAMHAERWRDNTKGNQNA